MLFLDALRHKECNSPTLAKIDPILVEKWTFSCLPLKRDRLKGLGPQRVKGCWGDAQRVLS